MTSVPTGFPLPSLNANINMATLSGFGMSGGSASDFLTSSSSVYKGAALMNGTGYNVSFPGRI